MFVGEHLSMDDYLIGIGKRIKEIRKNGSLTISEIAMRAGVTAGLISRIENGRTIPSLPVLLKIISSLDIEVTDFFSGLPQSNGANFIVSRKEDNTFIEKDASVNAHIEQMRLSATKALLERKDVVLIASVSAIYGLGDPELYMKMLLHLRQGDFMGQRDIITRLGELQYTRNDIDLQRGTFRVRGEVIDIFPAESERDAVRVELFDDEIEQLSEFDPLTGQVTRRLARTTVYPKSHYVTPREKIIEATEHIKEELRERRQELLDNNKLIEAQRISERVQYDIEMMVELGYCSGIENYSRYLSGRAEGDGPPTLLDYLPANGLLIIDESHVTVPQIGAMYKGDRSRKTTLVEYGFRLPSALDNRPLKFEEFEQLMPQTVFVSATPSDYELDQSDGEVAEQVVRPTGLLDPEIEIRPVAIQVDDLLSEIPKRVAANERVLITTLTKRMSEDLTEYLDEHGVKVRYLHSDIDTVERVEVIRDLRLGHFDVLVGINLLREGLDMPEVSLVCILDADKEGFLRSERSLIQTIGRAARNVNGKVILYADTVTKSMEKAIGETERRREKQHAHNVKLGQTPKGVTKKITDVMDLGDPHRGNSKHKYTAFGKVAESEPQYDTATSKVQSVAELSQQIDELEKQMHQHARDLEFEQAAALRDQVKQLREQIILNS